MIKLTGTNTNVSWPRASDCTHPRQPARSRWRL